MDSSQYNPDQLKAMQTEPLAGLQAFRALNEAGSYEAYLRQLFTAHDEAFWSKVAGSREIEPRRKYLREFPDGAHVRQAEDEIRQITEWHNAVGHRSVEALEAYLERYPDGFFVEEAKRLIMQLKEDEAAWKKAREEDTLAAYYDYLDAYRDGKYRQQAERAIQDIRADEQAWLEAKQADTVLSYEDYLRRYPEGRYREQAREALHPLQADAQLWQAALAAKTIEGFVNYIADPKALKHKAEARRCIEDVAYWQAQKERDEPRAYEAYQAKYPQGLFAEEAKRRFKAFRAEEDQLEAAYREACRLNTEAAYQYFFARINPKLRNAGKLGEEARQKLEQLWKDRYERDQEAWQKAEKEAKEAKSFSDEQTAYLNYINNFPKGIHWAEAKEEIENQWFQRLFGYITTIIPLIIGMMVSFVHKFFGTPDLLLHSAFSSVVIALILLILALMYKRYKRKKWHIEAASQGNAYSQCALGERYESKSSVLAYALFNLSAKNDPSIYNPATKNLRRLAGKMTSDQIQAAELLSRKLGMPGNFARALDTYLRQKESE